MSISQKHTDLGTEIEAQIDAVRQTAEAAQLRAENAHARITLQEGVIENETESRRAADDILMQRLDMHTAKINDLTARVAELESGVVTPPEPTPPPSTIITRTDETGCAGYGVHFAGLIPDAGGFDTDAERQAYCARVGMIYDGSKAGEGVLRVGPQIAAMNPKPSTIVCWAVNAMISHGAGNPCIVRASDPEAATAKTLKAADGSEVGMQGFTQQGSSVLDCRSADGLIPAIGCLERRLAGIDKTGIHGLMCDNTTCFPSRVNGLFTKPPADYGTTQASKDAFDAAWSDGMGSFVGAIEDEARTALGPAAAFVINPGRTALDQQRFKDWAKGLDPRTAILCEHFDDLRGNAALAMIDQLRALPNPVCFVSRHRIQTTAEWQTQSKPWLDLGAFAVIAAAGRTSGTARVPYWVSICPVSLTTRLLSTAYGPLDDMLAAIGGLGKMIGAENTGNLWTYTGAAKKVTLDVNTRAASWSA